MKAQSSKINSKHMEDEVDEGLYFPKSLAVVRLKVQIIETVHEGQ